MSHPSKTTGSKVKPASSKKSQTLDVSTPRQAAGQSPESSASKMSAQAGSTGKIDYSRLGELQQCFLERWDGKDKGLTRKEFHVAIKKTVGPNLTAEEVDTIYSRLDSQETGLLKWSTYITCLSTVTQLQHHMISDAQTLFSDKPTFIMKTGHRDQIVCIRFIPRLPLVATQINYNSGRYVMLGRQGTLTMWSIDFACIGKHYVGHGKKLVPDYFTDMVSLFPSPMIAVTSTDRSIVLFEFGTRGIIQKYAIVAITNCITCMDYWADLRSRTRSLLVWGDTAGDIHGLEINVNRLGGIFDKDDQRDILTRVVYNDLAKNKISCVKLYKATDVHNDWVTSVKYIPENAAFISTSRSFSPKALVYADWFGNVEPRCYNTLTSALCLDYCHDINVVVIGSLDGSVRVWDFFLPQRPIMTLKAHTSPVTSVALSTASQHVISSDKNYYVKVFDYAEGTCIQTFSGPSLSCLGKFPIAGFFYNPVRRQLVVASQRLAVMSTRARQPDVAEICAHKFPVSCACYSSYYGEIISACRNAEINVWDLKTGKHKLHFKHLSPRSNFTELPWSKDPLRLEVTALRLDSSERCAVSGANDGTVNLWNFTQGVLLSSFTLTENVLVTGFAVERTKLFMSSWCSKIYMLKLEQESVKDTFRCFRSYQKEEVNALVVLKGGLVATGSYDGTIIVFRNDTGQFLCRLNPAISQFPIKNVLGDGKQASEKENLEEDQDQASVIADEKESCPKDTSQNNPGCGVELREGDEKEDGGEVARSKPARSPAGCPSRASSPTQPQGPDSEAASGKVKEEVEVDEEGDWEADDLPFRFCPYSPTSAGQSEGEALSPDLLGLVDASGNHPGPRPTEEEESSSSCEESDLASIHSSEGSEENEVPTEDHSILKCVRLTSNKVMVADHLGGKIRIVTSHQSEEALRSKSQGHMVYDPFLNDLVTKEESAHMFRNYESSIEAMLYLETRKNFHNKTANILTAGAEGWIRAWSLHPKGGLKGQFLATEILGESVKAIATDVNNEWLITGDTRGYIKIWDLMAYCNAAYKKLPEKDRTLRREKQSKEFFFLRAPFLRDEAAEGFRRCARHKKRPPPETSNPGRTLKTPRLLNVFRAHLQAITSLRYVEEHDTIISTSMDCSVRLWTTQGMYVGSCGALWHSLLDPEHAELRPIPYELRKSASARSLRVIKGAQLPGWEHAVRSVTNYLEEKRKDELKTKSLKHRAESKMGAAAVEDLKVKPVLLDYPEGRGVAEEERLSSLVKFDWNDPKKSKILGMDFKPNLHHLHCELNVQPIDTTFDYGQLAAYRRVPVSEISEMTRIPTPPIVHEIAQRRKEEEEEAERYRQGESSTSRGGGAIRAVHIKSSEGQPLALAGSKIVQRVPTLEAAGRSTLTSAQSSGFSTPGKASSLNCNFNFSPGSWWGSGSGSPAPRTDQSENNCGSRRQQQQPLSERRFPGGKGPAGAGLLRGRPRPVRSSRHSASDGNTARGLSEEENHLPRPLGRRGADSSVRGGRSWLQNTAASTMDYGLNPRRWRFDASLVGGTGQADGGRPPAKRFKRKERPDQGIWGQGATSERVLREKRKKRLGQGEQRAGEALWWREADDDDDRAHNKLRLSSESSAPPPAAAAPCKPTTTSGLRPNRDLAIDQDEVVLDDSSSGVEGASLKITSPPSCYDPFFDHADVLDKKSQDREEFPPRRRRRRGRQLVDLDLARAQAYINGGQLPAIARTLSTTQPAGVKRRAAGPEGGFMPLPDIGQRLSRDGEAVSKPKALSSEERERLFTGTGLVLKGFPAYNL